MISLKKRTPRFGWLRRWAKSIKRDIYALWLAARDKRTPWYAKLIALLVAGYAISPIDLIPDFIPVLGYLDDVIIVPLGIMLAVRLIPKPLMAELREKAQKRVDNPHRPHGGSDDHFTLAAVSGIAGPLSGPALVRH